MPFSYLVIPIVIFVILSSILTASVLILILSVGCLFIPPFFLLTPTPHFVRYGFTVSFSRVLIFSFSSETTNKSVYLTPMLTLNLKMNKPPFNFFYDHANISHSRTKRHMQITFISVEVQCDDQKEFSSFISSVAKNYATFSFSSYYGQTII